MSLFPLGSTFVFIFALGRRLFLPCGDDDDDDSLIVCDRIGSWRHYIQSFPVHC